MNNNFKQLLQEYEDTHRMMVKSADLTELKDKFAALESSREKIVEWVFANIEEEEEINSYFGTFNQFETEMYETQGDVPVFGNTSYEDIAKSFTEYESYYQRYGCTVPEFIVSWDDQNILFTDGGYMTGEEIFDIVPRADVLMNQ